jgi:hypothetical protein
LIDLDKYTEWNPFIRNAVGLTKVGERLRVRLSPPNGREMEFKPTVKSFIESKEFSWLGHFLFPGVFDGEHVFKLKPINDGCLLIQKESFSGLLVPFFWRSLNTNTRKGFEEMNKALKKRAEAKSQGILA